MLKNLPDVKIDIARPVIEKWGGIAKMANETGLSYQLIDSWQRSGNIPEKWRPRLCALARQLDLPITPLDFIAYYFDLRIAA